MTNGDEADNFADNLDTFFACANRTVAGKNTPELDGYFQQFQTALQNIIEIDPTVTGPDQVWVHYKHRFIYG